MITVDQIMTTDVLTLTPDMDIAKAAKILLERRINGAPVLDDKGRLVGILCQSDLVAQQKKLPIPTLFTFLDGFIPVTSYKKLEQQVRKIAALTVAEAMTPDPVTVRPDAGIETVAALMADSGYHTLPVVQDAKLVGVIGMADVLRTLISPPKSN